MVTLWPVLHVVGRHTFLIYEKCLMECRIRIIYTTFIDKSDVTPAEIVSCAVGLLCVDSSTLDSVEQLQFLTFKVSQTVNWLVHYELLLLRAIAWD